MNQKAATLRRFLFHPVAQRLAIREYLPFGSWFLTWLMIGLAIGHADVVRLLAANTFAQAARAFCTLEVIQVLARRSASGAEVWRESRAKALKIDLAALAACALVMALLAGFVAMRDMPKASAIIAIVALGIPARHPGSLLVGRLNRDTFWRLGASAVAVAGAAAVLLFHLSWVWAAVVLAAREWGGLLATALFAGPRAPPRVIPQTSITFHEAAVQTEASARKRLGYRLLRTILGVFFGPFGNFAARTGRSAGRLDQKIARLMPQSRAGFTLFTGGTAIGAGVLLSVSREPSALLGAAALARLAASGAAALMWWRYRDMRAKDEDDDSDD